MQPGEDTHVADLSTVVAPTSTPGQIADHIMASVVAGALPEGSRLPSERDLAAALAVSRSSVRQALSTLERAGVVVRRRGRTGGTFISAVDPHRMGAYAERVEEFQRARHDLLDARAIVQNRIAATAAVRRSSTDLERMRAAADSYRRATTAADARTVDARLHHLIAQATGNADLVEIVLDLDRRINAGFRHDPFSQELFTRACADHDAIVEAIARQDAPSAGAVCEAHFRTTTMGAPAGAPVGG